MSKLSIQRLSGAALLLLMACGPSQEELDSALSEAQRLEGELATARSEAEEIQGRLHAVEAQNGEMATRLRALGQNVEALEGERSNLQSDLAATREERSNLQSDLEETRRALEELRERERQAQARLSTFRNLLSQFRALTASGRLRVRIVRNRMVVELPEGILFDSGRARVKEEGQQTLTEVANVLATIENREFQVAGHTDNVPLGRRSRFGSNWELSAARATNVATYLIAQGVPANRISAAGHADTQPVASNNESAGRQQNRRIEIVLLPNLDELPDLSSLSETE